MKKSLFTTVIFLWSASFLSLQAQDCSAPPAPFVNWSGCDKSGVNLSGANLTGANLTGANLTGANLTSADLSGADLSGATFSWASLQGANLNGANLTGASFSGTNFENADLSNANLTSANLLVAILTGANLTGANLTGVASGGITGTTSALPAGWWLINGYLVGPSANLSYANFTGENLSGLNLVGATLYGTTLSGANLSGANLTDANLTDANLSGADMTYATLSGTNVSGANLSNVNFTVANLSGMNLTGANLAGAIMNYTHLEGSNLSGMNLVGVSFGGANLDHADLSNAVLTGVSLLSAIMPGANLSGANLSSTEISGSNMSGANLTGAILTGANVTNANLSGANLSGATLYSVNLGGSNLTGANVTGVVSNGITGTPSALPTGWALVNGYLVIIPNTDTPMGGTLVQYSSNANYPTCYPISSTTLGATDSPESEYAGPDIWYRFTAQSTAAVVTMSSASMDDAIALYSRDNGGNYIFVGSTNASAGAGDFERLVVSGLTPGTMYYASLGSSDGTSGAFQVCVQHLMPSGCANTPPVGGFSLCDSFKARYRGAASQGVTYNFTFFDEGYNTTNTVSGTNGLITLSNPTLGLRWGALLDARVDVNYQLQNSAGTPVNVSVLGNVNEPACQNFFIRNAPELEVRTSQRCPATLLRSTWLAGQRLLSGTQACGAIGYTYEFTQVTNCSNTEPVGLPFTVNTTGATPYLQLGVLPNLSTQGAWKVRIASKYATINGINYTSDFGPEQYIVVNGTSAIEVLDEQEAIALAERNAELESNMAMYPNPNSGNLLNLNITDVKSESVFVRVLDATGRMVYSNRFATAGSLNTIIEFPATLSSGMYMVECTVDGELKTERLVVE